MTLPGYVLNAEGNDFYYVSISRLHVSVGGPSALVTLESTVTRGRCESSSKAEGCLPCSTPLEEAQGLWTWAASENKTELETAGFWNMGSQVLHGEVCDWGICLR